MDNTASPGTRAWNYGFDEILADGIIHALGLVLAVIGTVLLLGFWYGGSGALLASHGVYCGCLLITLTASAVYNMWPVSPMKWRLRRLDHAMIFALIAGTYTPFLIRIGDVWTNVFLALIWVFSLTGMVLKLLDLGRRERLSTLLYLGLGWSGLFTLKALSGSVPALSLALIIVGGVLYSAGSVFHHWRSLRFQNAIWHGFVLVAACCHFAAIMVAAET